MRLYIKGKSTKQPSDLKEDIVLLDTREVKDIVIGKDCTIFSVNHKDIKQIALRNEDILNLAIKIIAKHNN